MALRLALVWTVAAFAAGAAAAPLLAFAFFAAGFLGAS
jgi:hypothetical protein